MLAQPQTRPIIVLSSTFYTAALERPLIQVLARGGEALTIISVPYNQLHNFLLDPHSVIPDGAPAKVVLLLRVEDLVRLELVGLDQKVPSAVEACVRAFRERTEQFLDVLGRMSRLCVTLVTCPSARGAFDTRFLGNAIRVAEHKIAAELRRQQRHHIISWAEFERVAKPQNCFNPSGDRLGHVPFAPEGLEALATFLFGQLERMPTTILVRQTGGADSVDLERFLASLKVEMTVAPLTREDEQLALTLVRHTTHFVNWPSRKWENGDIRALAAGAPAGEAWTVRVRDRFGDYGVSGALTFGVANRVMQVGLLFLTCPVLGRQVEHAFLGWIARLAESRRVDFIEIPFVPGRDNQGLQGLLERLAETQTGMAIVSGTSDRTYRLAVAGLADRVMKEAPNLASASAILSGMQTEPIALSA